MLIPGAREVLTFQSPSVLPSGSMEATTFSETTTSPVLLSVICEGDTRESEHTCFPLSCQESSTMGGGEAPCLSADGWRGYGSPFCALDSLPDGSSWEGPGSPWGRRRSCPGLVAGHPRVREKQCVRLLHIQGVPFPSILWSPEPLVTIFICLSVPVPCCLATTSPLFFTSYPIHRQAWHP